MKKLLLILLTIILLGSVDEDLTESIEVRSDNNFPPYEFMEDGIPVGFNIDIMYAVTKAVNLKVNHQSDVWEVIRSDLENGEVQLLTGMFQSIEREKVVSFSTPVLVLSHSIFVLEGSDIKGLEDAKGKRILVQKDDITMDYLIENKITQSIIAVDNKEDALLKLQNGEADCALLSVLNAYYLMNKHDIKNIKEVGENVFNLNFCFAVNKEDKQLLALINEGLSVIKTNGTYDQIYEKWFGLYESTDINRQVLKTLLWILLPIICIVVLILAWSYSLKKQVNNKTKEIININDHLEELVYNRTCELQEMHIKLLETEKNSIFSELVLGVSHEMNTPLGNIMTLLTYEMSLKSKLLKVLNNDQLRRKDLDTYLKKTSSAEVEIKKSLDEIVKMINIFKSLDIKNLNKISTFRMCALLEQVKETIKIEHPELTINIQIHCLKNELIEDYSDALFQVLHGIVENAVIHGFSNHPEGQIEIIFNLNEDEKVLTIKDDGKGMTEHTKTHIFDYFFSEDKRYGTGLGLNRTHNIVHFLLNGDIEIKSELNKGTSVIIKW